MTPRRIRRQRTKGWRMPEGAVYVGRPTRWGNPWLVGGALGTDLDSPVYAACVISPVIAVALYEAALLGPSHPNVICGLEVDEDEIRRDLAGKDLACWCALDQPCHADVLLAVANG